MPNIPTSNKQYFYFKSIYLLTGKKKTCHWILNVRVTRSYSNICLHSILLAVHEYYLPSWSGKSPIFRSRTIVSFRVLKWGFSLLFSYQTGSTRKLINKILENNPATVLFSVLSHLLLILSYPHSYKLGITRINGEITAFSHTACTFLCPCYSSKFRYCHDFKSSAPRVQPCYASHTWEWLQLHIQWCCCLQPLCLPSPATTCFQPHATLCYAQLFVRTGNKSIQIEFS